MRGEAFRRVRELVRKEFIQIGRDPRLVRLVFIAPLIQLVVFGYAVSTDVRNTALWVVDEDRSASSRRLIDAFIASGSFRLAGRSEAAPELAGVLDRGAATAALHIPPGFAVALERGDATVQLLFDGTNSNLATVSKGHAERIVQRFGAAARPGPPPAIDLRARAWFNPDLSSRDYNVPAVVGAIVFLMSLLLTSLAVVREREMGTLEQLLVSPLRSNELIAGKTLPFALIGLADLALVTAAALGWFGVPFRGSFVLFLGASLLYLLSGLGIGLFISTVSSTQREAFLSTFLIFMPTILLSGFMFPVESMPGPFQVLTLANPMRHFLVVVRGVFLKGVDAATVARELGILAVMGGGILFLAARRFRRMTA